MSGSDISLVPNPCCNQPNIGVVLSLGAEMRRRDFIKATVGVVTAWPVATRAQQSERLHRIAVWFSNPENDPEVTQQVARFQDELTKLGWVEGRAIHIDYRFSAGNVRF